MTADYTDLIGSTSGIYTVLRFIPEYKGCIDSRYYECLCSVCQSTIIIARSTLKQRQIQRCQCKRKRKAEGETKSTFAKRRYGQYKTRAKIKGCVFTLDLDTFTTLFYGNCVYCGQIPEAKFVWNQIFYANGIDRDDNTKGYTKENSVSCCSKCNGFKGDYTGVQFTEHSDKVSVFNARKKSSIIEYIC